MYTPSTLSHLTSPRNLGSGPEPTYEGAVGTPGGGPYVVLKVYVSEGIVLKATYECNGCTATIASASALCELIVNKSVDEAMNIQPEDINTVLGGLPDGKGHAPVMATQALRNALVGGEGKT
ncbi:MAG: iron-sulfur cluster assembly scaffold protein [Armatimonadetes bacterium]|nr:iron-sulfur cluster assembly scaffold protein [Armatimonadota bacterium]